MIFYFFILFIFLLPGCRHLVKPVRAKKNESVPVYKKFKKNFKLRLKNLHCKLCAYNLVKFISKIPGVTNVKFNYIAKNYQQSYFDIEIDKRKITHQDVTVPLIKAGFVVDEVV